MNILLCFDDNYSVFGATTITSFCINNQGKHHIYIITNNISEINKRKLSLLVQSFDCDLHIFYVREEDCKGFPIGKHTANNYINIAAYFRLFMLKLLPDDLDKILYFDCDIIVNSSLKDLWNKHFPSHIALMAVEDDGRNAIKGPVRLGYSPADSYFNTGMLFLDLVNLRSYISHEMILNYIFQNTDRILFHDQDVLNALLHDKKQFLPLTYNVLEANYIKGHDLGTLYRQEATCLKSPVVIHFSGPIKPWHIECKHPYKKIFYKYLGLTPYKDFQPIMKYPWFFERTKYILKQMVKFILETFGIRKYSYMNISDLI